MSNLLRALNCINIGEKERKQFISQIPVELTNELYGLGKGADAAPDMSVYECVATFRQRFQCLPGDLEKMKEVARDRLAWAIYGDLIGLLHELNHAHYGRDERAFAETFRKIMEEVR